MQSNRMTEVWRFLAGLFFFWRWNARYIPVLGGPGAGKGTQAPLIAQACGLPHLSTGDLFRAEIAAKTQIGLLVKQTVESGGLVPDDLTMHLLRRELKQRKYFRGAVLDGFPRTLAQAQLLDRMLFGWGNKVGKVILLDVPEADLIERLSLRRTCSNKSCGRTYHVKYKPPVKADTCDVCGSALYQRADDVPDKIRERIRLYRGQSKALCDYYQAGGRLTTVTSTNGMSIEKVTQAVLTALKG